MTPCPPPTSLQSRKSLLLGSGVAGFHPDCSTAFPLLTSPASSFPPLPCLSHWAPALRCQKSCLDGASKHQMVNLSIGQQDFNEPGCYSSPNWSRSQLLSGPKSVKLNGTTVTLPSQKGDPCSAHSQVANIATGETSQAIAPCHCFHFFSVYHWKHFYG